jgi:hypothetical protein
MALGAGSAAGKSDRSSEAQGNGRLSPFTAFDPVWYRATYADVTAAGVEPLNHFLRVGKGERRVKEPDDCRPVAAAKLECLKRLASPETMALFVTYAPAGRIKRARAALPRGFG